ncbi:Hypothetical protein CINCED_3A006600 [Cinara cedri]|uniref:RRM domain-containing protein n=1 Tax=Cinara cedri TaxID=506608 RepID=A0A5E4N9R5_9HEMI|nr:Hypothetical protein CINCED_3A006600 [Cinara cedri]
MKFVRGKKPQNGRDRGGRSRALQSGPRNRLRLAAANKAAKVKRLKVVKNQPRSGRVNNRKMLANNNSRVVKNTVVDARLKLLQKALHKPTPMVDARQKLTKQKDAREKIQERRLHSSGHNTIRDVGMLRGQSNNLSRVKIDRRGILTVKSILDERVHQHYTDQYRDRRPVNQGRFNDLDRRRTSSNTFNSDVNTFRSDRSIEDVRPLRRDARMPRNPVSNSQTIRRPSDRPIRTMRVNDKPYHRPMAAMDFEDAMDWEEPNRYSPSPLMRRNLGNTIFNRADEYHDDLSDRNGRNHRGISETLRSRLDSHQMAAIAAKRVCPVGHKIVISNLEPSVTSEDIRELFADIGDLFESRVVRPGVAEVIYERRADAIQAVDVYHNRQLDGRPMKCDMR